VCVEKKLHSGSRNRHDGPLLLLAANSKLRHIQYSYVQLLSPMILSCNAAIPLSKDAQPDGPLQQSAIDYDCARTVDVLFHGR
jgi:hypothetical protein